MAGLLRLVLACSVLLSLFFTSSAQTCKSYSFSDNRVFATCADLSQLNSFLHWNYSQTSGVLQLAYRHTGITSTGRWVSWAINPNNNLNSAMPSAQALVSILPSNGTTTAYTSPIPGYSTQLEQGTLQYNVSGLTSTFQNNEIIIFATVVLPNNTASVLHVWQEGALSGNTPQAHSTTNSANLNSKGNLDLLSGVSQSTSGNSRLRKRNIHGVLNAVSWGVLLPIGALFARYLRVFKSADPAWFYLHITCQAAAYIVGVAGWGTGLKLGSDSVGVKYNTHRTLGIILFCFGTLQVFALLLRPNKDHKFRFHWNIYHHLIGYSVIIISIINVFKGFDILQPDDKWKHAYIGIIAALGGIAVFLEAYTWIIVLKRRKTEKLPNTNGANGVNGYGARA